MEESLNTNILIVGMSKTGKTHFGGQLYGRLQTGECPFQLESTPDNTSLFKDVWEKLNQGLEGQHTESKLYDLIKLPIVAQDGTKIDLSYPDYGGEQIKNMIKLRQVNSNWQDQITGSDHWFLFIRMDLLEKIKDVTTAFYKEITAEKKAAKKTPNRKAELSQSSAAFYVELLQTLLSVKNVALSSKRKPKLTVLISCWDKLKKKEGTLPSSVLEEKVPFLSKFINSVWLPEQLNIYGLSSLGRSLKPGTPDKEFAEEGPENFGYIILPTGEKEEDITQLLTTVLP